MGFDEIARLAARLVRGDEATLSLGADGAQVIRGAFGPDALRRLGQDDRLSRLVASRGTTTERLARPDLPPVEFLGVPLLDGGSPLGTLGVSATGPRAWSEDDLRGLEDLASCVAEAVASRGVRETAEAHSGLRDAVDAILSGAATFEEGIGPLLSTVARSLGFDVGEFWYPDPDSGELRRHDRDIPVGPWAEAFAAWSRGYAIRPGEGLVGQVWASCEPACAEIGQASNFCRADEAAAGMQTAVGFPILGNSQPLGVMTFLTSRAFRADDATVRTLRGLGRQIGEFLVRCGQRAAIAGLKGHLEAVLDAASQVSIIATDSRGGITMFNAGAERMLGYAREEMIGLRTPESLHLPEELAAHAARISREIGVEVSGFDALVERARRRRYDEREWTYVTKGGDYLAVSLVVTAMRDVQGQITGYLGIAKDITRSKRAERELRKFAALVENCGDIIAILETDGRLTHLNQSGREMIGMPDDQIGPVRMSDLLAAGHQSLFWSEAIPAVMGGGRWSGELALRVMSGGPPIECEGELFPVLDPMGNGPIGLGLILRDLRPRRSAEAKILESELRFRNSFDHAPIGMALVGPDGRWLEVNRSLCSIVGYSEEELLSLDFQAITHADDLAADLDHVRRLVAGEVRSYQMEKRYIHKDGHEVWVVLAVSLIRDAGGSPLYFVSQIDDITRRKWAGASLIRAKEDAESSHRAKAAFLANMSHEVRTPMTAVLGYADLLLDPTLLPAERDEAVLAIRRNGSHLLRILDDVLDLSKIEAGRMELERVPYSPWVLIQEVASLMRARAKEGGIRLATVASGELPAIATLDPTRLRQVVINLVSNALKFTPPGGNVEVRLSARRPRGDRGATLTLVVEDTGIGMSADQVDQLFVPFQQADTSTMRKFGGTGLGLSICRRLVEAMGGRIEVETAPGRGSRFTVELPLALPARATWHRPDGPECEPTPSKRTRAELPAFSGHVLVVEDSREIRRIVTHVLGRMGLKTSEAENGRLGVERARAGDFNLVFMDMQMPELDGYGATAELRREGFRTPIVAMTAHAMASDRQLCLDAGCDDYLKKPITADALAEVVGKYLLPVDRGVSTAAPIPEGLLRAFAATLPSKVDALRAAVAEGDAPAVAEHAHRLRGVGGMYGHPELTETAASLEDAARAGCPRGTLATLLGDMEKVIEGIGRAACPAAGGPR